MLSTLRAASRASRAVPRLVAASRTFAVPMTARAGYASITASSARFQQPSSRMPRLFSTAPVRAAPAGETDAELVAKLESELQFEDEMASEEQAPSSVKDYLANSPFDLVDTPGSQEVKMVRKFGDENVTITFSVSEVPYEDQYPQEEDDIYGEDEDPTATGDNKSRSANKAGNNLSAEDDAAAEEDDVPDRAPPVHFTVTVEKPGKTDAVLAIECTTQDGDVLVEYVNHYGSAAEAFASSPEASHARVERYTGPSFATLDEDLQVMMENYLDERGVTPGLAVFLPDYVEYKEQKEYMRWLKRVKDFVEA